MFPHAQPKTVLRLDASAAFAFPARGPLVNVAEPRRRKLWDFSTSLHCSIVGTCLTMPALRKVVGKSIDSGRSWQTAAEGA